MKVTQHLWFEKDMEAAIGFYTSLVQAKRVGEAMLKMMKLDIDELEAAARG